MSNLAYEGFCPSCHNYWIFCDCVHSFGTIGEDLAKDEGEEGDDDDMEEIDPSDPNSPPSLDNIEDLVRDPDLGSPGPSTPGFTGTPGNPSVLSPTNPDDPVSPVGSAPWGASTPGQHLSKPTYKPRPRDPGIDAILNDVNDAADIIHDIPDLDRPYGKKPRLNDPPPRDTPMNNATQVDSDSFLGDKPGARLPADMNSDILQQVGPSDFDDDPLMDPLDLSTMLNNAADNLPRNAKYDIASLNRKYQHYGDPEFLRRGPRPDTLRANGLPVFDGPMFKEYPPGMSNQDKQNPANMSQEYIDFLNNKLRPWIDTLKPEVARVFDTDCYVSVPQDRVPERVPTVLGPYTVELNPGNGTHPNIYNVTGPNGTIQISTKMDISVDFFKKIHPDDLPLLLKGPNQNGRYEFITEYNKGSSPQVVIGQNQQGRYPGVRIMVSGVHKISNGIPITFYHEGGYDNHNEIVRPIDVVAPPDPVYYYRKNTVDNTRRLVGTGTEADPFIANYENYNAGSFMTASHGMEIDGDASSLRTTADNWGDPLYEMNISYNVGGINTQSSQVFKFVYEMINESNDPSYTQSTFGLFRLKFQGNGYTCAANVWIDKQDGSKVYPRIVTGSYSTIKPEGDPTNFNLSLAVNNAESNIYALIECPANDGYLNSAVTPNKFCGVNVQFYAPVTTQSFRGSLKQSTQLVKTNTINQTYIPNTPNELIGTELVGYGKIIPSSFTSEDGLITMSSINYKNIWTKILVWRRVNNAGTIWKYMVNSSDTRTHTFAPYIPSSGAADRQRYVFGTYIDDEGKEAYTDSDFIIFNNNFTYPITSLSTDILQRATMTLSFAPFIF
jgi:hypothetical protein